MTLALIAELLPYPSRSITVAYEYDYYCNNGRNVRPHRLSLYLFDLLWHDGYDITGKTVLEKTQPIGQIIAPVSGIQARLDTQERMGRVILKRFWRIRMVCIDNFDFNQQPAPTDAYLVLSCLFARTAGE
jgi:hypothetical protein